MFKWLKSILWDNRNEPFLVLIGAVLLIAVLFILAYQIFYREAPLACGDVILPSSRSDCPEVEQSPQDPGGNMKQFSQVPIGTIVAYFGTDIPSGWALCDGQDNPNESKITIDADSSRGGIQLPDLRAKFIRGSARTESPVKEGGNDTISLNHAHLWAYYTSGRWYSYRENNHYDRVDNWNDGLRTEGSGDYPLLVPNNTRLYTKTDSMEVSNLPSYVELRFIIRIF